MKNIKTLFLALAFLILPSICSASLGNVSVNLDFFHFVIESPLSATYVFEINESFVINLSISSDRAANFWYSLRNVTNDLIHSNVSFVTNTTFVGVSGLNQLIVYGQDSFGNIKNSSVDFYISFPNYPPNISDLNSPIYVCEGDFLSYIFNVTHLDHDVPIPSISPQGLFFIRHFGSDSNSFFYTLFSGTLTKSDVGGVGSIYNTYVQNITMTDESLASDSKVVNITLIEINNAPVMEILNDTNILSGANFFKQISVNDTEDGNESSGNISFNITFNGNVSLFNISSNGVMNYTSNGNDLGTYNITVCAIDKGINASPNIGLCDQDGLNLSVCINFLLIISSKPVVTGGSGGGGGGGGAVVVNNSSIIFIPNYLQVSLKKEEYVKKSIKIKNKLNRQENLTLELSPSLKKFAYVFNNKISLGPFEEKSLDIAFFSDKESISGLYTGVLRLNSSLKVFDLPIVFNLGDKSSLLDVRLNIPEKYKVLPFGGENLFFEFSLIDIAKNRKVDARLEYLIKDLKDNLVFNSSDLIGFESNISLMRNILLPDNFKSGKYVLGLLVHYDNSTAVASAPFEVQGEKSFLWIFILFAILLIIIMIYLLRRYYVLKKKVSVIK